MLDCLAPSRAECDVTDFNKTQEYIKKVNPTLVINLAGESCADRCNSDLAWSVNAHALTNICYALATHCKGAKLFQAGSINQILNPSTSYAKQKAKAAATANSYSKIIEVLDAKLCTVEDGYRKGFIVSDMIKMLKVYNQTKVSFSLRDMTARKWLVDADSMCEAVISCCETQSGGSFYLGPSSHYSLEEIFCEACYQLGINTVKNGNTWLDADNGRVIMSSQYGRTNSSRETPDFGTPYGALTTNLRKIVNSIILSA
jgi:GDP-D-mannose dehydratase